MLRSGRILYDEISLGFDGGVKELLQPPPTTMTLGAMMWRNGDIQCLELWRVTSGEECCLTKEGSSMLITQVIYYVFMLSFLSIWEE